MAWQQTPYTLPLLAAAAAAGGLGVLASRRAALPGARPFAASMAATAVWCAGYGLEIASPTLAAQLQWSVLAHAGVLALPAAWLVFSLEYAGPSRWLTRRRLWQLAALSGALWLGLATNAFHGLYWTQTSLADGGTFVLWRGRRGPLFWLTVVFTYSLLAAGSTVLLRSLRRGAPPAQVALLLLAAAAPWLASGLSLARLRLPGGVDPTPLVLTLSGGLTALALLRFEPRGVLPIARDAVFDVLRVGLVVLDPRGVVVEANPAACALLELARGEAVGRPLAKTLRQPELAGALGELAEGKVQIVVDEKDGQRYYDLELSVLGSAHRRHAGWLLQVRDVTEAALLRQRATQRETMAAIGAVVSGVAHEVRNPLFGISAALDAMLARLGERPDLDQHVELLRGQVDRLSALMEDLLDYGRPRALRAEAVSFADLLARSVRACAQRASEAQVRVESTAGDELLARLDTGRIEQVLVNLIHNAVQHSPPGSTVRATARPLSDGPDGLLECAVVDQGRGIAPEDLPRLFEPFFGRRKGGTGLGLAIASRIVADHGGTLTAENAPEGGARFVLRLPIAGPPLAPRITLGRIRLPRPDAPA